MPFTKPGAHSGGGNGYKPEQLNGSVILLTNFEYGQSVTKFSPEPKGHVDCDITPVTGKDKGVMLRSRVFSAYIVSDLQGCERDEVVIGKVRKGVPREGEGLYQGWILEPVEDPKILAQAEILVGEQ